MREYGKIHSSFWTSQDIRGAGEDGRTLAAYLLTSPHSNMLGCFRVPLAYVSDDLKWPSERVLEGFEKLSQRVWLTFDKGSEWVVIHKFLKWNQPENPNVVRAAEKTFAQIPGSSRVKSILAWCIAEFEPRFSVDKLAEFKPFPNPFDTSRKGYRKPEPEPEPEPEPNQNQSQEKKTLSLSLESEIPSPAEKPSEVEQIFAYWQKRMGSPRSNLDDKRRKSIKDAIAMGYSPEDLCKAIRGCSLTPHNMGQNDRSQKYNGIALIFRSADQIDRFIANDAAPPRFVATPAREERRRNGWAELTGSSTPAQPEAQPAEVINGHAKLIG